jgi:hypothetical protein
MIYLALAAVSVFVGAGVYAATLRGGREAAPAAVGFEHAGDGDDPLASPPGYTYLRIGTRGPSWSDRVAGFVGLVVLLAVATAALTLGIYQLGHLVVLTVERYFAG